MRGTSVARLACAVAGLALVAGGLAGPAGVAQAGARSPGAVRGGIISTVAGGVGGPGPARSVAVSPCGLSWAGGWLYMGDGLVRRVSMATGALTTVAGDDAAGPLDSSGTATASPIGPQCGTVLDGAGNLVIAAGLRVLVVAARTGTFYGQQMTAGHVYVVAGTGDGGPVGDGGPATQAFLTGAEDVAFDQAGNLLIADVGQYGDTCADQDPPVGSLVQVVAARTGTFYGQQMTVGDIYTVAGVQSFSGPSAGNGGLATQAWLGNNIGSVRPDRAGNLVVTQRPENDPCDPEAPSVQVIATVTGTFYGMQMTAGHIYQVAGDGQTGSGGDGGRATAAPLDLAGSAVTDDAGNLVIGDGSRVRVVAERTGRFYGQHMISGHIYGIAGTGLAGYSGDGGPAVRARVSGAGPVAFDGAGNVLVGVGHRVRVVTARTGRFYGVKMTAGDIYTVAGNGMAFSGDGGPPLRAEFTGPTGISADRAGDIAFTTDGIADDAIVELIPARSGTFFGRRLTTGHLYTLAGNGNLGFRGDGGPARHAEFDFFGPDVAFDGSGNVVVADEFNGRVRLIAVRSGRFFGRTMTAGDVYTIAGSGGSGFSGDGGPAVKAKLSDPTGAGVDHHGNVLIADGLRVRVVAAATATFYGRKMVVGHIYTVAGDGSFSFGGDGGAAVKAGVSPEAVATDAAGNLIIADQANSRVRLVAARTATMYGQKMTVGDIYTIAGGGQGGSSSSGGPATQATLGFLGGVTTERHGNVIIADSGSADGLVWVVAVADGTFYGQVMTAGDIYAVAGGGTTLGDGGPATSALLSSPIAVAVSRTGSLLVTDRFNNRLRAISP